MQPAGPKPLFSWELEDGTVISIEPKEDSVQVPNSRDFLPADHLYVVINNKIQKFVGEIHKEPGYPDISDEYQQKVMTLTKELKDVLNDKSECDFDDQFASIKDVYNKIIEQEAKVTESKKAHYEEQVKLIDEDASLDPEQKRLKKINAQIEMNFNPLLIANCGYGGILKRQERQKRVIQECLPLFEIVCTFKNNPDNTYDLSAVSQLIKVCAAMMRIPELVVTLD